MRGSKDCSKTIRKQSEILDQVNRRLLEILFLVGVFFVGLILYFSSPVMAGMKTGLAAYKIGDYETAFREFSRQASKGNPTAQSLLGTMYEAGMGVPRNHAEAFQWYIKAAVQGEANAQFMVGQMYYEGRGGPADWAEASRWYRLAAQQGYAYAQYNLGVMCEHGRGILRSIAEAIRWYTKAAEQGVDESQCRLGEMYADGYGVAQDLAQAYMWLDLASAQGNKRASSIKDQIALKMTPAQIARSEESVRDWKKRRGR